MITIRKEEPGEIRAISHVNEQAFDQENEANIIKQTSEARCFDCIACCYSIVVI